jgi:hypothetical protein
MIGKKALFVVVVAAALALPSVTATRALAHGEIRAQHGGQVVEVQGQRLELVVDGGTVDVYVTDHDDRPVPTGDMTGKATLLIDRQKAEVALRPAGGNRLTGTDPAVTGNPSTAIVVWTTGGKTATARFVAGQ